MWFQQKKLVLRSGFNNSKWFQDLGQTHTSILNGDPNIILGHHSGQPQVTVSAGGQQIPISQIITTQSGQGHGNHFNSILVVVNQLSIPNA